MNTIKSLAATLPGIRCFAVPTDAAGVRSTDAASAPTLRMNLDGQ